MIADNDIMNYAYMVGNRFEAINVAYIKKIANQINEIGKIGPANLHRLEQMAKMTQNIEDINNLLAQEKKILNFLI